MLDKLKQRFLNHMERHETCVWEDVESKLKKHQKAIEWMEQTGGEPDVLSYNNELYVIDMSPESPNRRSVCYDLESRLNRKKFPPETSALELCDRNHVSLVDEAMYRFIQHIKPLDTKTSSWIYTPKDIRSHGGALFGDYRYGKTFIYHNGADSYYGARGFRTYIKL